MLSSRQTWSMRLMTRNNHPKGRFLVLILPRNGVKINGNKAIQKEKR